MITITQRNIQRVLSQIGCFSRSTLTTPTQMVPVTLSGTIVDQRKPTSYVIETIYGEILLFLKQEGSLHVGDRVGAKGSFMCPQIRPQPFSYDMRLLSQGYIGGLSVSQIEITQRGRSSFSGWYIPLAPPYQGIPEGLLYGTTDTIDSNVYQNFIDSGLIYLLAASGGNISRFLMCGGVLFLWIPLRRRRYLLFFIVGVYTYFLRENISLIRAMLSYTCMFLLSPFGRVISKKHIWIIVCLLCILWNPFLVLSSWGFILSCVGVWGLIHIPQFIYERRITRILMPVLRAQVSLVGPLLLFTQHCNVATILLSFPATLCAMISVRLSLVCTLIPRLTHTWFINLLFWSIKSLCSLASFGTQHGVYITLTQHSVFIACGVRAVVWLILRLVKRESDKHYFTIMN